MEALLAMVKGQIALEFRADEFKETNSARDLEAAAAKIGRMLLDPGIRAAMDAFDKAETK